ncbi:hypothetical protein FNZ56_09185 [Pseudoluteimonas lycopersici]|uniref:Uncharacterized protein n=1 Tax=Pseudoluteimonas lycopersici TaxID=1324796 RepID=A0A516V676_9GAMM|nr:hypothetical protein [Lysobacter lycopersici]QDQ74039.1 hypothetical protein FNZ56_09185 [Lysobacter lycopersici]
MLEKIGQQCQKQSVKDADRASYDDEFGKIPEFHCDGHAQETDKRGDEHQAYRDGPLDTVDAQAFLARE